MKYKAKVLLIIGYDELFTETIFCITRYNTLCITHGTLDFDWCLGIWDRIVKITLNIAWINTCLLPFIQLHYWCLKCAKYFNDLSKISWILIVSILSKTYIFWSFRLSTYTFTIVRLIMYFVIQFSFSAIKSRWVWKDRCWTTECKPPYFIVHMYIDSYRRLFLIFIHNSFLL